MNGGVLNPKHFPRPLVRAIVAALRRQQPLEQFEALLDNGVTSERHREVSKQVARLRALSSEWRDAIDYDARCRNLAIQLPNMTIANTMTLIGTQIADSTMRRLLVRVSSSITNLLVDGDDPSRVRNLIIFYYSGSIRDVPGAATARFVETLRWAVRGAPHLRTLSIEGTWFGYVGTAAIEAVLGIKHQLRRFASGAMTLSDSNKDVLRAALGNKFVG